MPVTTQENLDPSRNNSVTVDLCECTTDLWQRGAGDIVAMKARHASTHPMTNRSSILFCAEGMSLRCQKELVLLYRQGVDRPARTTDWLNARGYLLSHHHIRCPPHIFKGRFTEGHYGRQQPRIQTEVLGYSLVHLLILSHRSLVHVLHTVCFALLASHCLLQTVRFA